MEYSRKLLDDLMGPDRNQAIKQKKLYTDENVCKDHLVSFCPNELFTNTKSDLGQCYKIHDDKLRDAYLADPEREKHGYESKFFDHLGYLIRELDRRVRRAQERLSLKGDMNMERLSQAEQDERREKMILVEEKIKSLQERIEICGEEGEVDEAKDLTMKVETYSLQLQNLKAQEAREKKMEVCDACGSLLVQNDVPERLQAHLEGKQHTGFVRIRNEFEKLRDKYERKYEGGGGRGGGAGGGGDEYRRGGGRDGRSPAGMRREPGPPRDYPRRDDRRRSRSPPPPSRDFRDSRDRYGPPRGGDPSRYR